MRIVLSPLERRAGDDTLTPDRPIQGGSMKPSLRAAALLVSIVSLCAPALAQWDPHAGRGTPRTAAGEPDLDAPAPRTADGKPDLSGLWQGTNGAGQPAEPAAADGPPIAGFLNVAQNVKGGLPLKAEGEALLKARRDTNGKDNPEALCLPMGIMQFHTQGAPRKFIQTPDELVILYEASMGVRQIFTDGRAAPASDPQPWYYGYSVGRWDGDTLVVETTGLRDDGWLDVFGTPLTDAAKLTERFLRTSYGRMQIDVTVDDPKVYTRPWTVRVIQRIMPDQELLEFVCLENQRFGAKK
jgi:hypothetical protein